MKKLFNHIITIVFSIVLFCFVMIMITSSFFTEEMMQKNFQSIDVTHEMKKIQNSTTSGTSAEVADLINTAYAEAESHGIDKKLVNTIFNDNEMKSFLGGLVGSITDYVVNGKKGDIPTSDDFNKLLDNNIDRWIDESGVSISDSKKEVLLIRIKSMSSGIIDNMPNYMSVKGAVNDRLLDTIKFIFSDMVKIILGAFVILFVIILYFLNRKDVATFKYVGCSLLISSVMMFVVSFSLEDVVAYVLSGYNLTSLINSLVNLMMMWVIIVAVSLLVIGVLLLLVYRFRRKKMIKA